jgi:hypothetical protein
MDPLRKVKKLLIFIFLTPILKGGKLKIISFRKSPLGDLGAK